MKPRSDMGSGHFHTRTHMIWYENQFVLAESSTDNLRIILAQRSVLSAETRRVDPASLSPPTPRSCKI